MEIGHNWINESQSSLLNDRNQSAAKRKTPRSFVLLSSFFLSLFLLLLFFFSVTSWILPSISTLWSFHASTSFPCDRSLSLSLFFSPLLWNETPKLGEKRNTPHEAAEYKIDTLSNSCATYSLSLDLLFYPRVFARIPFLSFDAVALSISIDRLIGTWNSTDNAFSNCILCLSLIRKTKESLVKVCLNFVEIARLQLSKRPSIIYTTDLEKFLSVAKVTLLIINSRLISLNH